jgi:hypothetical protein
MEPNQKERFVDQWLDAGLMQHGQAEPRSGLEDRILARLRAPRNPMPAPKWQWWPALAAVAAVLLIGMFVAKSKHDTAQPPLANGHLPIQPKRPETSGLSGPQVQDVAGQRARIGILERPHSRPATEATSARLEQFPSPQPLSKQEEILQRYLEHFPREAALTARAQTQLARQEMMERELPLGSEISPDSEQQNQ